MYSVVESRARTLPCVPAGRGVLLLPADYLKSLLLLERQTVIPSIVVQEEQARWLFQQALSEYVCT
jgi:hypothetical protein